MREMSIILPTSPLSERGLRQPNGGGGGGGGNGDGGDKGEEMGRSNGGGGGGGGRGEGGGGGRLSLLPTASHPLRVTRVIPASAFGLSLQLERAGADLAIVVVGVDAVGIADGQGGVAVGQMITHVVFFSIYYSLSRPSIKYK